MNEKKSWRDVYQVHPAADVFPMLPEDELRKLGEDIKTNGLIEPIVLWSADKSQPGYLLDGRNRLAAMELVGIDHRRTEHLYGDRVDPLDYVISKNIRRRHLTKEQQADLIVKVTATETPTSPSLARSVKRDSTGRVQGSAKDPLKAKVIEEAKKRGISKRTMERSLAKARTNKTERTKFLPSRHSPPKTPTKKNRPKWIPRAAIRRIEAALQAEINAFNRAEGDIQQWLEFGAWLQERAAQWTTVREFNDGESVVVHEACAT